MAPEEHFSGPERDESERMNSFNEWTAEIEGGEEIAQLLALQLDTSTRVRNNYNVRLGKDHHLRPLRNLRRHFAGKIMASIFLGSKRVVMIEYLDRRATVTCSLDVEQIEKCITKIEKDDEAN
ncbi:hypothetical protein EVAR_10941_1 [Eumeta japonica]|uniref:Uncharacterized protein n=1 Tax=Eumeta variegata TaxID=151549 RepID=A0A4C1U5V7_EUMVA|nr:hypothetical protein EVAR_10941_1 [Eumeta japonica]